MGIIPSIRLKPATHWGSAPGVQHHAPQGVQQGGLRRGDQHRRQMAQDAPPAL